MIIDCHTHIWQRPRDFGLAVDEAGQPLRRLAADVSDHMEAAQASDLELVLGFAARHLSAEVPLEFLGEHVGLRSTRMVGILGVDPTDPAWRKKLGEALDEWSFRGVTLCPACQDIHPMHTRALALYDFCSSRGLPIFVDLPGQWHPQAALGFARPALLDTVAREFPALKLVVCGFGYPYVDETLTLLEKFPTVFADTAHLAGRPLVLWSALARAHEAGLLEKVFYGSGFPFVWPRQAQTVILNQCSPQRVPAELVLSRRAVDELLHRDSLAALGIARPEGFAPQVAEETAESEDGRE